MATEKNDLEEYFEWWLNELKDHGFIRGYKRESEKISLFPEYKAKRLKYFKTKPPEEEVFNFAKKYYYTYDYKIMWMDKAKDIFYQVVDFQNPKELQLFNYRDIYFCAHYDKEERCYVSLTDVKPPVLGAQNLHNTSYHTFPLKQNIILWLHGLYINKVIPFPVRGSGKTISLFPNTFTPKRYTLTDGRTRTRKIKFHVRFLNQYLEIRKKDIDEKKELFKKFYSMNNAIDQKNLFDG